MLQNLHVKNLALMEETEVEFKRGLNILTGETGAGKSLLLGSINLALGAKFEKEMLRQGADTALVELTFSLDCDRVREKLAQMELGSPEDEAILISRRMQVGKSVFRINGETVTARQVKELAEVLIDIHGQHEHQSLLHRKKHLEILDSFCTDGFTEAQRKVEEAFLRVRNIKAQLESETLDEAAKLREQALAQFELDEIEAAHPVVGEDTQLEDQYRFMTHSKKIMEGLSEAYEYTGHEVSDAISRALRVMLSVSGYNPGLQTLSDQLSEIEALLGDFNRDVADFMTDCEFDDETFTQTESRLNELNRLKGKYGNSLEAVLAYAEDRRALLQKLEDYDAFISGLQTELSQADEDLRMACAALSDIRKANAAVLEKQLKEALEHLNFTTVLFEIAVRPEQTVTAKGWDEVEFLISTNPGEPVKPLGQVASGGELSRVMLAIKTVMAGRDDIDTLIFDEIDAGISGRTAWCVSEQLNVVAHAHQVICITHLPQIAAMADCHFCIEKSSTDDNTITDIYELDEENSLKELARLLGSDALTQAALQNAKEMKAQAAAAKVYGN